MLPQSAVSRAQIKIKKNKKNKKKGKKIARGFLQFFASLEPLFASHRFFFSLQNLSIFEILFQQLASLI